MVIYCSVISPIPTFGIIIFLISLFIGGTITLLSKIAKLYKENEDIRNKRKKIRMQDRSFNNTASPLLGIFTILIVLFFLFGYFLLYLWPLLILIAIFLFFAYAIKMEEAPYQKRKMRPIANTKINFKIKNVEKENTTSIDKKQCSRCHTKLAEDALFCHKCGKSLNMDVRFCQYCGKYRVNDAVFCHQCGNLIISLTDMNLQIEKVNVGQVPDEVKYCNSCGNSRNNKESYCSNCGILFKE